jgi:YVTN family beta-propeller protein
VSCGETNAVLLFDPVTLHTTGTVAVGTNPDAMLYDAFSDRVFVFNHSGGTVTVLNAATAAVVGTVEVGGALEVGVSDGAGTIFVNVEDKNEVVAIDAKTLKVKHHWPLAPGEEPTGLGYDGATHRLFSACGNKRVVALDARTGKMLGTAPSGDGSDGLVVDESQHLAFASNGDDSTLTVIRTDGATTFPVVQQLPTARGARTVAIDPVTHHIYLSTATYGPVPAPTAAVPKPRRSVVPGSFRVLDVAPVR